MSEQYTCDCSVCMKGGRTDPKPVGRSTWYSHAPNRKRLAPPITPYADYLAEQPHIQHNSASSTHSAPRNSHSRSGDPHRILESSRPSKRHRTSDLVSPSDIEVQQADLDNEGMELEDEAGSEDNLGNMGETVGGLENPGAEDMQSDIYMPDGPMVRENALPTLVAEGDTNPESVNEIGDELAQPTVAGGTEDPDREGRSGHQPELEDFNEVAATLEELKIAQQFIEAIRGASLDNDRLPPEVIERLRRPIEEPLTFDGAEALRTGVELFLDTSTASEEVFNKTRETFHRSMQRKGVEFEPIPTLFQVKERIKEITGVYSILHDMCPDTCVAYTGPFSTLDRCPKCNTTRYDEQILNSTNGKKKIPRRQFHTIPPGPQLQALYRSPERAAQMQYRRVRTKDILDKVAANGGSICEWSDILHGRDYLDAVRAGRIQDRDILLMMSIDGAQLYQSKQSDCWIYIWVVFELEADVRYMKEFVMPGGFIGGPNKFQNGDSFLFPGFHHVAALMKEGLAIWDALDKTVFQAKPFLILGAADGPGLTYLNGLTGHSGAYGCRLYCPVKGRRKDGGNHYYPALLKPENYSVEGCDHADVDGQHLRIGEPAEYQLALNIVLSSQNATQHQQNRKRTGITKPSIFSAFPPECTLPVPRCFGGDMMHLISLNLTDLLLALWRGTIECDPRDDKHSWDWVVLIGNTWKRHGARVAATKHYLPGSFDRPPRNPAEKISSGYKAWEFLTYIFGLGPGLFYQLLPDKYWRSFCKLVAAIRILHQRSISQSQLLRAHKLIVEFVKEFEELYYQRKESRLHFCRQSIHALLHLAPEVTRLGPGVGYTQWTMERTIGNLGEEIRQPSNAFQNLSERGVRRARANALMSMLPELAPKKSTPRTSEALGDGYTLSMPDRSVNDVTALEISAIRAYLEANGVALDDEWSTQVRKWARLQLPNGQFVRTAWKENQRRPTNVRISRNIMIHRNKDIRYAEFAEVQIFFQIAIHDAIETVALISKFGVPDGRLGADSNGALLVCHYQGVMALDVIPIKLISSCVAMVPFKEPHDGRFFVCEKMGLEVAYLGGAREESSVEDLAYHKYVTIAFFTASPMSLPILPRRLTRSLTKSNSIRANDENTRIPASTQNHDAERARRGENFPDFMLDLNSLSRGPTPGTAEYYFRIATHQQLLQSQNEAHTMLYDGYTKLNATYQELRRLYDDLIAKFGSVLERLGPLSSAASPSDPTSPASALSSGTAKPKKEDHPHIKFWTQTDYNKYMKEKKKAAGVVDPGEQTRRRGGTQLAETGENVSMEYIEDENGNVVSGKTAANIRECMRSIFSEMKKPENIYTLPLKWNEAGITERKFVFHEMYMNYPYLRYCDDDWKARSLASAVLSSFHGTLKRKEKNKATPEEPLDTANFSEPVGDDEPSTSSVPTSKRKATNPPASRPRKRSKAASKLNPSSSSSSDDSPTIPHVQTIVVSEILSDGANPTPLVPPAAPTSSPPPSGLSPPSVDVPASISSDLPVPATQSKPHPRPKRGLKVNSVTAVPAPVVEEEPSHTLNDKAAPPVSEENPTEVGPVALINPLNSVFGPPSGPAGRGEALQDPKDKTVAVVSSRTSPGTSKTVFAPGKKRPTASLAAKNLYYIEYLKTNDPVTPALFEALWKALGKDEQKKWNMLSKQQKEDALQADDPMD